MLSYEHVWTLITSGLITLVSIFFLIGFIRNFFWIKLNEHIYYSYIVLYVIVIFLFGVFSEYNWLLWNGFYVAISEELIKFSMIWILLYSLQRQNYNIYWYDVLASGFIFTMLESFIYSICGVMSNDWLWIVMLSLLWRLLETSWIHMLSWILIRKIFGSDGLQKQPVVNVINIGKLSAILIFSIEIHFLHNFFIGMQIWNIKLIPAVIAGLYTIFMMFLIVKKIDFIKKILDF